MFKFSSALLLASAVNAAVGVYDYLENGANWDAGVCQTGRNQSPINFTNTVPNRWDLAVSALGFDAYKSIDENAQQILDIGLPAAPSGGKNPNAAIKLNLGTDVRGASMVLKRDVNLEEGAPIIEETMWNPLQLHFHQPSEHTLNGELFVAEMHIVHTPINGFVDNIYYPTATQRPSDLAVLGMWFEESNCRNSDAALQAACEVKLAASEAFFEAM